MRGSLPQKQGKEGINCRLQHPLTLPTQPAGTLVKMSELCMRTGDAGSNVILFDWVFLIVLQKKLVFQFHKQIFQAGYINQYV